MCNEDLTKIDAVTDRQILEVLNWLSYNREKTDLINEKNKQR